MGKQEFHQRIMNQKFDNINVFQHKNWDIDITLEELFKNNEYIMVDRNYTPSDNKIIKGYCLYLKHPKNDTYSIMIGVDRMGFVHIGDEVPNKNYPMEFIGDVYTELMYYRDWILRMGSNKETLLYKGIDYDSLMVKTNE